VDANGVPCDASNQNPAPESTGIACTEVLLNPDEVAAAKNDPAGVFPTPVDSTKGPNWIQIGTERGFLPMPVVVPPQHITWVTDPTVFNAGNVDKHSLLLGPAERADVIVDFSAYAGKTMILYNDAPAAFPARDPRYDYYTDNADLTETGGAPTTLRGYGPNTRTVMQIKIQGDASVPFDLARLNSAFMHQLDGDGKPAGVFESSNDPIVIGQKAYNDAYGTTFSTNDGLVHIFDTSLTFKTLLGSSLTMPLKPKMIQDEMGEAFELDYGRMSGMLGVEAPNPQAGIQNMILYPYPYPPTEILDGVDMAGDDYSINVTPIATTDDGTQIWKITHNGVDTHPVHWHMYNVQLINRVGWDGIIRKPDLNELGWKDTVRVSPLEDTVIAVRPIMPHLPFDVPNSIRLLDPTMPEGAFLHGADTTAREAAGLPLFAFDPNGEPIDIRNHKVNFGWEYVWHCHILSHEEMDMMRSQAVGVPPKEPANLTATRDGNNINLIWTDASKNETSFTIERALGDTEPLAFAAIATIDTTTGPEFGGQVLYTDTVDDTDLVYSYRILASNLVGDAFDYSDPNLNEGAGFPTMNFDSGYSNIAISTSGVLSEAPSNLSASNVTATTLTLNWQDNSTNEDGFRIERATDVGFTQNAVQFTVLTDVTFYDDSGLTPNTTYYYHILAFNAVGDSPWSVPLSVTTLDVAPSAPSTLTADNITVSSLILHWQDNSGNETGFRIERATSNDFLQNFTSFSVAANVTLYSDDGLTQSTTYYYRVYAFNSAGDSLPSPTLTISTANPTTPPARPTNLTAVNITRTSLTLTWQDNSDNEDGFTIQRATNQGFTQNVVSFSVGANVNSFNDSGLTRNTRYYYRVRAFNVIGNSQWSPVLNVRTLN
jgi:FtsP/CotA-like multicopper oxidase with cupredoxin domain